MSKINFGLAGIFLIFVMSFFFFNFLNTKIELISEDMKVIQIMLEDIDNDLHLIEEENN